MKTKVIFASALALLAASCTQNEMEQLEKSQYNGNEGISFVATMDEGATTRGDFSQSTSQSGKVNFDANWFADKDVIGVFYKAGSLVEPMTGTLQAINGNSWVGKQESGSEARAYKFRASASGTTGYFVADSGNDMLALTGSWNETNKPTFRVYYPYSAAASQNFVSETNITLPAIGNLIQTTTDGVGVMEKVFMVSESTIANDVVYDENDNSIAKNRLALKLKRVNPIVYFQLKLNNPSENIENEIYKRDYPANTFDDRYGVLKSVKLEALGSATISTGSNLTFNTDAAWDIAAENVYDGFVEGTYGAAPSATTIVNNLSWNDNATVFMPIANVSREAFRDVDEKENLKATYTFEKITFEKTAATDKDWDVNNANNQQWYSYPAEGGYKLYEDNYTVYMKGSDYVLEINKDFDLADAFDVSDNVVNIKKANGDPINKLDIKHFVSKVALNDDADYAFIRSLSNLTNITMLANTEIPAGAFSDLSSLVYLNLPKVTTVGDNAFPDNPYKEVYMGSYNFEDEEGTNQLAVRNTLLKAGSLVKADISGVKTIGVLFVQNQYPTFMNFTKLQEIKVQDNVTLATAAFRGCKALTKVDGTVVLNATSNSQFANCVQLATININGTVIPEAAFSGCKLLTTVNNGATAVVPTYIGESAFAQTKLSDIDLSTATTIGKSAFEGCESLTGGDDNTLVVKVAQHISDRAFYGCNKLQNITFEAATSIGADILNTASLIKKIEFKQVFKLNSAQTGIINCFGSVTNTKQLFCHKDQPGVEFPIGGSPKITLTNEQGGATYTYTFMSIDKKYGYQ